MIYRVTWEIDVDADNPTDAARKALAIQRRKTSVATVFDVRAEDGAVTRVDLDWREADLDIAEAAARRKET